MDNYGAVFFEFITKNQYLHINHSRIIGIKYVILSYWGFIESGHFFITIRLHYIMAYQFLNILIFI